MYDHPELLGRLASAKISSTEPDGVTVWYLGCNEFVLKDHEGTTLFIDPYLGTGDPPRTIRMIPVPFEPFDIHYADAILVTHEHVDHVHGPSKAPILSNTGGTLYGPDEAIGVARDEENWPGNYPGITDDQLCEVSEGTTFDIGEFTVHVEPASDSDAKHPGTYVLDHRAGTFFHGGDSRHAAEFSDIGTRFDVDLGVLAFGSVRVMPHRETRKPTVAKWYNDENQLTAAARDLEIDRLLSSHWDMWKRLTADPTVLRDHFRAFPYPRTLELVEIGESVTL